MDIILKSGHVIRDVRSLDNTKNPIALWIWSSNQARDNILAFDKISVRASEIAAMIGTETLNKTNLNEALNQLNQVDNGWRNN